MSTSTPTSGTSSRGRRQSSPGPLTRLPSTRERRPALIALGLLLVVGGMLASAWLALQLSDRADYLRVKPGVTIEGGEALDPDDFETVSLPDDVDGVVPVGDRDDLDGRFAATLLLEGTILDVSMVQDAAEGSSDQLGLIGEFPFVPPELTEGQQATIVLSIDEDDPDRGNLVPITVTSIGGSEDSDFTGSSGGGTVVGFSLDPDCAAVVNTALKDESAGITTGITEENAADRLRCDG